MRGWLGTSARDWAMRFLLICALAVGLISAGGFGHATILHDNDLSHAAVILDCDDCPDQDADTLAIPHCGPQSACGAMLIVRLVAVPAIAVDRFAPGAAKSITSWLSAPPDHPPKI